MDGSLMQLLSCPEWTHFVLGSRSNIVFFNPTHKPSACAVITEPPPSSAHDPGSDSYPDSGSLEPSYRAMFACPSTQVERTQLVQTCDHVSCLLIR